MPERVVTYTFRGNLTDLQAKLSAGGLAIKGFGNDLSAVDKQGAKMRAGLTAIGDTAGKVGLGAAAGLGLGILAAANFEQSMAKVRAATMGSAKEMGALSAAALKAGAETSFSATEAAGGIEALAKAGVSTADILNGGLSGALNLAAAGQLDVAAAAEQAATAMTQFGLSGDQVNHVADLLSAGAGKAQGSVADLGAALNQSGLVAAQMGLSIEETTGGLAAFASAGLLGSDAGTSFKAALAALTPNSAAARKEMERLGINAFDAQGNFIGLAEFAGNLQTSLSGLTDQQRLSTLETIFGSDAVRAASVLYEQGQSGIAGWIGKTDDAGYAAESAAILIDTLRGDIEALGGSLETAFIGVGDGSQGPLRSLVQGATDTVNAFSALPAPIHTATTAALGFAAVFGGGAFLTSKTINGLTTTREAMTNLGVSAETASKSTRLLGKGLAAGAGLSIFAVGLKNTNETLGTLETTAGAAAAGFAVGGPWGAAIGGAIGLVVGLGTSNDDTADKVAALTGTFDQQTGAITENTRAMIAKSLQDDGVLDAATQLGISTALVTDAVLGNATAQRELNSALAAYGTDSTISSAEDLAASFSEQEIQTILANRAATDLRDTVPGLTSNFAAASKDALQLAGAIGGVPATGEAAGTSLEGLSDTTGGLGSANAQTAEDIKKMSDALRAQYDAAVGAFDAVTQYRQALKGAREQAKRTSAGIEGDSDAVVKNRGALSSLAGAWNNQTDAVKNAQGSFKAAKSTFIETAIAMGVPEKAAKDLARELLSIPPSRVTTVTANTSAATAAIAGVSTMLRNLDGDTATTYVRTVRNDIPLPGRASGGFISGPGTGTSDSIPARLSNGEYVIKASAVSDYGVGMLDQINARRFADGGPVSARSRTGDPGDQMSDADFARKLRNQTDAQRKQAAAILLRGLKGEQKDSEKALGRFERSLEQATNASEASADAVARETSARDDLVGAFASLQSDIAGMFTSDLFASTGGGDVWRSSRAGGMDPISVLLGDIASSQEFSGLFAGLQGRGLTGNALQLGAQGGTAGLQSLAGYTDTELAQYAALVTQREQQVAGTGALVAQEKYGQAIANQNAVLIASLAAQDQMNAQLAEANRMLALARQENREDTRAVEQAQKESTSKVQTGNRSRPRSGGRR